MVRKFFKWLGIAFGVLVALAVVGAIIAPEKTPEEKAAAKASLEQKQAVESAAKVEKARQEIASLPAVTASELASAYDSNTVAADQRFKGKKFKVSGTVSDINTDFTGDPYLILRSSGNPFMSPHFGFEQSDSSQLAKISKGSKVTMVCVGKGDIAKTPMAGDCALL